MLINLESTNIIKNRIKHANELAEILFLQIILADDRAIRATYANGNKVYKNDN